MRMRRAGGFTLVELMVSLTVFAILMAIAAPSFMQAMATNRVATATNDVVAALSQARTEAIRRNRAVTLCNSTDGASCSSGGWSTGWIAFVDLDRDAVVDDANGETVLLSGTSSPNGITVIGNSNVSRYISYVPGGAAKLTSGAMQLGTVRVCSSSSLLDNDHRARDIVINAAGRVVTTTPTNVGVTCPVP